MEDQAVHVAGQIGEGDPGLGVADTDGANEQALFCLLVREHRLDAGTDLGRGGVAFAVRSGIGRPLGLRRWMRLTLPCRRSQRSLAWLR